MGIKGTEIIKVDVKELLDKLNRALAEEWLAYYQYWIGTKVIEGPMRSEIEPELMIHANQELNHAVMIVDRVIQLGGKPVLSPDDWTSLAECDYLSPDDPYVEAILNQNLQAERCAIKRYTELADFTGGKDHSTYQIVTQILNEELEHEQEIEDWINDIDLMKKNLQQLKM